VQGWTDYFELAKKSDFLMGKVEGSTSPWCIIWAVKYKNYQKVTLGQFPASKKKKPKTRDERAKEIEEGLSE
jgi:hypothetical protein